jgi:hypothetical protein
MSCRAFHQIFTYCSSTVSTVSAQTSRVALVTTTSQAGTILYMAHLVKISHSLWHFWAWDPIIKSVFLFAFLHILICTHFPQLCSHSAPPAFSTSTLSWVSFIDSSLVSTKEVTSAFFLMKISYNGQVITLKWSCPFSGN